MKQIIPRHTGVFRVAGVGRVGTYEAARAARRCRARQHWVIQEGLHEVRVTEGQLPDGGGKWVCRTKEETREDLGHFKTKKAAIQFLLDYAREYGLVLEGDVNGYPWMKVPVLTRIEEFVESEEAFRRSEAIAEHEAEIRSTE